ncbi:MAG: hypothetical protein IIA60_11640 [Candidatus Marinimicrobia bacterium]|nr:hypothetical protein [Candidatus Neomarinimicrobiota bacterium]
MASKKIGVLECGQFPEAAVFAGNMVMEADFALPANILDPPGAGLRDRIIANLEAHVTTLRRKQEITPSLDVVATAVVDALEENWALAVYPSFPTPDELDTIEQFDSFLSQADDPPADDRLQPGLVSIAIGAGATLLQARHTVGEDSVEAVVWMVNGRPEHVQLNGGPQSHSEPDLRALAVIFNGAVPDTDWRLNRFTSLAGSDAATPAAPPGSTDPALPLGTT